MYTCKTVQRFNDISERKFSVFIGAIVDGFHDTRGLRKISFRRSSNCSLPLPDGIVSSYLCRKWWFKKTSISKQRREKICRLQHYGDLAGMAILITHCTLYRYSVHAKLPHEKNDNIPRLLNILKSSIVNYYEIPIQYSNTEVLSLKLIVAEKFVEECNVNEHSSVEVLKIE